MFTKDENVNNTNRFRDIPKRPTGERNAENNNQNNNSNGGRFQFMGGFGFIPFFGFNFNFNGNNNNENNNTTNSQDWMQNLNPQFKQALIHFSILFFMIISFSSISISIFD